MAGWIDYRKLRQGLSLESVLLHYGIKPQMKGVQHVGHCPLPTHGKAGGQPTFSANLGKGIWQCFGCKASGNVLDFAVRMEKFDPTDRESFRKGALRVRGVFLGEPEETKAKFSEPKIVEKPVLVNAPLDFELKGLDANHPSIQALGLSEKTISFFGLGYASKGLMVGRIAFPLHDREGKRIGYGGRIVAETQVTNEKPLYLLPSRREHKGTVYDFDPTRFLYNGHSFKRSVKRLIVVQSFESVWRLHERGYPESVAAMGEGITEDQEMQAQSLLSPKGSFCVVSDGTEASDSFGRKAAAALAAWKHARWLRLPDGKKVVDHDSRELGIVIKRGEL